MPLTLDPGYYDSDTLRAAGMASVGDRVLVSKQCNLIGLEHIHIGSNVRIDFGTTITAGAAGVTIGSYVHIGAYCYLSGGNGIFVGDFANLSQRVSIYTASDDYTGAAFTNPTLPKTLTNVTRSPVQIGGHTILGSSSIVLPGVELGEGTSLGALSLLTKNTEPWTVYAGIPAKRLKARTKIDPDGQIARELLSGTYKG